MPPTTLIRFVYPRVASKLAVTVARWPVPLITATSAAGSSRPSGDAPRARPGVKTRTDHHGEPPEPQGKGGWFGDVSLRCHCTNPGARWAHPGSMACLLQLPSGNSTGGMLRRAPRRRGARGTTATPPRGG